MTPITTIVKNSRLGQELQLHVINDAMMIDFSKKKIQGQIQSFKTSNILDAITENGYFQAANISVFEFSFTDFKDLNTQVQNFVDANIQTLTSK